ncbi:DUF4190 domain-containing protein [Streptomyces sp. NBC_00091]|uniref:DUF4190 domain-containing protein n=1 Tax=Streptomyces sp. NBC_00091 TaxID=2975648 RepID=UPI0022594AF4|nr:DUF4190 domain-containing protein [Streptomyces sp. NBC_00091]MCX5376103.1 DUF4190 domain-containing protein [Streptomyces sp. NBC_00091]
MSTPPPQQPPVGPGHSWPPPSPPPVWGPPAYRHPPALNGLALASLLVGLLCFPPLGIVFGIVALVQIARKGERGRALAIVGLVVSVVMSAVLVAGAARFAGSFLGRLGEARELEHVEGQLTGMDELRPGDCFNVPGGDLLDESRFTYRVGCDQAHDAEVTSTTVLGPGGFPSRGKLKETATDTCWKAQDAYAMDTWALPSYAEMFYFAPSAESWQGGDRRLLCLIGTSTEEHRGSLRKDAGMLTPDQVTLLSALNAVDQALGRAPDAELDEELAQYRTWAREVDEVLAGEERTLQGAVSRPGTGPAAAAQLKEVAAARKEWQRASRVTRPADFQQAWDAALGLLSVDTEKALRGAYGLSTRVPEWLEGGPEGPGAGSGRGPSSESV